MLVPQKKKNGKQYYNIRCIAPGGSTKGGRVIHTRTPCKWQSGFMGIGGKHKGCLYAAEGKHGKKKKKHILLL